VTTLRGEHVVLRPLEPGDEAQLRAALDTPEVAEWWTPPRPGFPFEDEPELTRFAVLVDGDVAGMVQYYEEPDPDGRYADVDVFLHPDHHGHGIGTDTLATLIRHLTDDRGHHRVQLSTSVDNARAIRVYEKLGFRRVGTLEASWRDRAGAWRDELLMERVVRP
jgi:aminoglycoside 6'-N-acetyltransferase